MLRGGGRVPVRRRRPNLGALVAVGAALVNAVAAVVFVLFLWQSRDQARAAAAVSTQNLARLLDEDLTGSFEKIDLALLAVADEVERQAALGHPDPAALDALLAREKERAPDVMALRLVDRDGVAGRAAPPAAEPVNVADRDYFIGVRQGRSTVVSRPFAGRILKVPAIVFARRLVGHDGEFAGAAIGSVQLAHVAEILSGPDVGKNGAIALRGEDMHVVARSGRHGPDDLPDPAAVSDHLQALLAAGHSSGTYDAVSPADGVLRTYSFRRLQRHPFYVFAGLAHQDYLAPWRRQAGVAALLLAAFVLLTSLGALLAVRAGRRERRAEEGLAAEKEWLAVTLRSIGEGVIATDLDERVLFLNGVAERLCGWAAGEAQGRPLSEVFCLVDRLARSPGASPVARALGPGGAGLTGMSVLTARDGRECLVTASASPIRDGQGKVLGAVLVFRDVTAQERAEQELARVQKVDSLSVLAGGIAHDFNNLLTAVTGNISVALEATPPGSPAAEALADAALASRRARDLTQQLLTFSRGGAPIHQRLDLSAHVEASARSAAHGSGVDCQLEVAPDLLVEADPAQVGQVVQNLVRNGIEAMASSGTLTVRTEPASLPAGNPLGLAAGRYAVLTVEDHGPGIPPDVLPHVFDPFFTTKARGKGLGLAICHSIVRRHDGHIEVASRPGAGATFRVYLPAAERTAATERTPVPRAARVGDGGRRILVMDDDDAVRRLAVRLLRPLGYDVLDVCDGDEAVARYAEARARGQPFAVVIMDLTVPGGVGGLEALGKLRAVDPEVAVVVSSGYSDDPVLANWADHGFRGVLHKPYQASDLRETLSRVLS